MALYRLCSCGTKHQGTGQCAECRRKYERQRERPPTPYTTAYSKAARAYLDKWVREHGEVCPGAPDLHHAPHQCGRHGLTVDHVIPLSSDGALMDTTNWRPLCRAKNNNTGHRRSMH